MDRKKVIRSTGVVAGSTFISRIFGFVRDILISSIFGMNDVSDAFYVAFRIPNLFRRLVAEGALTISFIPVYTDYLHNKTRDESEILARKTVSVLILILFAVVSLGIIFSPQIVNLFAYGFTDDSLLSLTVLLNRLMFPYLFLVGIVSFCMGYLNSNKHFFAPAFSPVLLNVGIICGAVVFSSFFEQKIMGLAFGVLFGGIMQLLLQLPYMRRSGFRFSFMPDFKDPGIRRIFRMMTPALLGIAIYQINILVNTAFATTIFKGAVSSIYYSDRLTEIVLGIFVVSIANVILPEMSAKSAKNDVEGMKSIYAGAAGASLFFALPASAFLMSCSLPIVSTFFERNNFTHNDSILTSQALFYAAIGLSAVALVRITMPVFYAVKNTKIPVFTSFISLVVNAGAGYLLIKTDLRHAGLTLAVSIAAFAQIFTAFLFMRRKFGKGMLKPVLVSFVKSFLASVLFGIILYIIQSKIDWSECAFLMKVFWLFVLISTGAVVYLGAAFILRIKEIHYLSLFFNKIRRKFL